MENVVRTLFYYWFAVRCRLSFIWADTATDKDGNRHQFTEIGCTVTGALP